jgi:hypothetical protein
MIRLQYRFEGHPGTVKSGHHRTGSNIHNSGNFCVRKIKVIPQDQNFTLVSF